MRMLGDAWSVQRKFPHQHNRRILYVHIALLQTLYTQLAHTPWFFALIAYVNTDSCYTVKKEKDATEQQQTTGEGTNNILNYVGAPDKKIPFHAFHVLRPLSTYTFIPICVWKDLPSFLLALYCIFFRFFLFFLAHQSFPDNRRWVLMRIKSCARMRLGVLRP